MNDFERALSDALKKASDEYRPTDPYEAKARFLHRLRRRRIFYSGAGVALAGAAVVAGFLFFTRAAVTPDVAEPLPPAADIEVVRDIAVGERPSGVAYGDGRVWVANSGDGTVMVIDPITRTVTDTIQVGGDPDDVAVGVGAAWVSDSGAGTLTRVPLKSAGVPLEPETFGVGEPGSTHMDVAPGADGLWIAKDDSVFRVDPTTNEVQPIQPTVEAPTDIAVGEGSVYILGATQLARITPPSLDVEILTEIPSSENQDIAFQEGFVWIANGDTGEVMRFDPVSGQFAQPIFVGGSFSGISIDEDAVWVISGGATDTGVLTRIDPDTLAVREPRAELSGRPYDITTGAGAVWVANLSAGTVSGLDPEALPGAPAEGDAPERDIVFVVASKGDIFGETMDGDLIPIVQTNFAAEESSPTISPDGRYVAFARGIDPIDSQVHLVDLESGEQRVVDRGWGPEFGPDGRLAWVRPAEDGTIQIAVGAPGDAPVTLDALPDGGPGDEIHRVTWDLDGTYLYYTVGPGPARIFQTDSSGEMAPFELFPNNHQDGAQYLLPSVRADGAIHVIRVCCDPTPSDYTLELGMIRFTEGGPSYESVTPQLDLVYGDIIAGDLDSAGNLVFEVVSDAPSQWRHTQVRSWFLSGRSGIWLVRPDGTALDVATSIGGLGRIGGLDTAPRFDN